MFFPLLVQHVRPQCFVHPLGQRNEHEEKSRRKVQVTLAPFPKEVKVKSYAYLCWYVLLRSFWVLMDASFFDCKVIQIPMVIPFSFGLCKTTFHIYLTNIFGTGGRL